MSLYELTFVTRYDISNQEVEKITESYIKLIKEFGGAVIKNEYWGLLNLAYEIKKNRKGHYVMLGVDISFECLKEIERRIKLNDDIIRHIAIKVKFIDPEPSAIMKSSESDGDDLDQEEIVIPTEAQI